MAERRRIRTLARGTRQVLGLRTVLGRQQLRLVVLDEAWEGLDPDASRWLSATIETKRDRGAAVVLSSHRLHDLAGVCDSYLFLVNHGATLLHAQEISPVGTVTGPRSPVCSIAFAAARRASVRSPDADSFLTLSGSA
jgi:ABC-2 type transport system ATP-binding protein